MLGLQEVHPNHVHSICAAASTALGPRFAVRFAEARQSLSPLLIFEHVAPGAAERPGGVLGASLVFTLDKANPEVCSKGCVAASWRMSDIDICVINAHLEAGHDNLAKRNKMQSQIEAHFVPTCCSSTALLVEVGDLNYRLEALGGFDSIKEPTKERPCCSEDFDAELHRLLERCEAPDFQSSELWPSRCQLRHSKAAAGVFSGFEEAPILFRPTYKRAPPSPDSPPGMVVFDREAKRLPGWCDRVLWRAGSGLVVTASSYSSVESATYSDHRPVYVVLHVSSAQAEQIEDEMPPADS